jgi:hypothetical protein
MGGGRSPSTWNHGLLGYKEHAVAKDQVGYEGRRGFSITQWKEKILELENTFGRVNHHLNR